MLFVSHFGAHPLVLVFCGSECATNGIFTSAQVIPAPNIRTVPICICQIQWKIKVFAATLTIHIPKDYRTVQVQHFLWCFMLHPACRSLLPCCRLTLQWSHHVRSQMVPRLSQHEDLTLPLHPKKVLYLSICHQRMNQNTACTQWFWLWASGIGMDLGL